MYLLYIWTECPQKEDMPMSWIMIIEHNVMYPSMQRYFAWVHNGTVGCDRSLQNIVGISKVNDDDLVSLVNLTSICQEKQSPIRTGVVFVLVWSRWQGWLGHLKHSEKVWSVLMFMGIVLT